MSNLINIKTNVNRDENHYNFINSRPYLKLINLSDKLFSFHDDFA